MASVTPRRNKNGTITWRVQFRIDGRMKQETFLDHKGALKFGELVDRVGGTAALKVLRARQLADDDTPTLRQWTETYLDPESGMLTGIEPRTRDDYRRNAERSFLQILGEHPIDAIERNDVGKWVEWQERQPSRNGTLVAAKTVKNYQSLLSSVLTAAVEARLRDDNPAHRTRISRGMKREGVFLSRQEFTTLLHFIPDYYRPLVLFLVGTGARWGEATAVTWGDIDVSTMPATVRINKAWKKAVSGSPVLKHTKTSRSNRTISMWPDLIIALGEPGKPNSLIFKGKLSGTHLWPGRFRENVWLPALRAAQDPERCAAAGLELLTKTPRPHDLRHTHASWLIAAGAPLPFIQARLGHESITTTIGVYGHLLPDAHVVMSEIMADTMSGVLAPRLELTA